MVYDKKRSGDPDLDDKVPADEHAATVVQAGDGTEVRVSDSTGPVDENGAHVNLGGPSAEDLDTRPAPGGQAEVKAEVQTYSPEDAPVNKISEREYLASGDQETGKGEPKPAPAKDAPKASPAK